MMKIRKYKYWQTSVRACLNWNKKARAAEGSTVIKIYKNGSLMGSVVVKDDYISWLSVKPAEQRKGYGTRLLRAAEAEISKKFSVARLIPQGNDESLRRFYGKLGYGGFSPDDDGYEEEDKDWWIMSKKLGYGRGK